MGSKPTNTPTPDLVWRAQISGLLRDLTAEVVALTEVVWGISQAGSNLEKRVDGLEGQRQVTYTSNSPRTGKALIARIREFHKDCEGCPVEQMCDEYEAVLADKAVLLTVEQAGEVNEFLGRIIGDHSIFSAAHDIYDDAYIYVRWFPSRVNSGV